MKTAAFDELKARASDVPIEDVIAQRGIELKGNSNPAAGPARCAAAPIASGSTRQSKSKCGVAANAVPAAM